MRRVVTTLSPVSEGLYLFIVDGRIVAKSRCDGAEGARQYAEAHCPNALIALAIGKQSPALVDRHLADIPREPGSDDDEGAMAPDELRAHRRLMGECKHEWAYTGTAYGGDDPSYNGEGRCYCIHCGADGDA